MIIAEQKSLEELSKMIIGCKKVMVAGCNTCVAICFAGGEKEAGILASVLRIAAKKDGTGQEIIEQTVQRQCEWEFLDEFEDKIKDCDVVISLACGIGIQGLAERYPNKKIMPGVNTTFLGFPVETGVWEERCAACGECILGTTAGICPIARCAKGLLNGPCGGSQGGKCEISSDTPCAWQLIYDRLKEQGLLEVMEEIKAPKNWSKSSGPRKIIREDLTIGDSDKADKGKKES